VTGKTKVAPSARIPVKNPRREIPRPLLVVVVLFIVTTFLLCRRIRESRALLFANPAKGFRRKRALLAKSYHSPVTKPCLLCDKTVDIIHTDDSKQAAGLNIPDNCGNTLRK
jgi:hypothetical protein